MDEASSQHRGLQTISRIMAVPNYDLLVNARVNLTFLNVSFLGLPLLALENTPKEVNFTKLSTLEGDLHSIKLRIG